MTEVKRIRDQIERSHKGPAWHGPSVNKLLDGVSAEAASLRPVSGGHTIWELVLHIAAWENAALTAVTGGVMPEEPEDGDWQIPEAPSVEAWSRAIGKLKITQSALEEALDAFPEERLGATVPGREYSFYFLLHGIAQHNLYHAGQIALLKKAF